MTLLSNRCTSARGDDDILFSNREPPYGVHIPQYFYIHQRKPQPMAPLKAWRGYKGNVYFEPMRIQKCDQTSEEGHVLPNERLKSAPASYYNPPTRATTAATSTKSYRVIGHTPQLFVMDKNTVLSQASNNNNIVEDLHRIEGMESTGSLAVRPASDYSDQAGGQKTNPRNQRLLYKRDKICKGPNFHRKNNTTQSASSLTKPNQNNAPRGGRCSRSSQSYAGSKRPSNARHGVKVKPNFSQSEGLVVNGDKFAPPTVWSPVLRTTPLMSLTSQRAATNSPDFYGVYDRFSHLDQMRMRYRDDSSHGNPEEDDLVPYSRPPSFKSFTEETKPLVKVGPDVNADFGQANFVN